MGGDRLTLSRKSYPRGRQGDRGEASGAQGIGNGWRWPPLQVWCSSGLRLRTALPSRSFPSMVPPTILSPLPSPAVSPSSFLIAPSTSSTHAPIHCRPLVSFSFYLLSPPQVLLPPAPLPLPPPPPPPPSTADNQHIPPLRIRGGPRSRLSSRSWSLGCFA